MNMRISLTHDTSQASEISLYKKRDFVHGGRSSFKPFSLRPLIFEILFIGRPSISLFSLIPNPAKIKPEYS